MTSRRLQAMKTGALLQIRGRGRGDRRRRDARARAALGATARALGSAFQIADDILDAEATRRRSASAPARTPSATRARWSIHGLDGARRELDRLIDEAIAAVDAAGVGAKGDMLRETARFVADAEELRAAPTRTSS